MSGRTSKKQTKAKLDNIPAALKELNQWVVWRYQQRGDQSTKVPYQVSGAHADSTDPKTWDTFDNVVESMNDFDGIGFMFSESDEMVGIDFDDVVANGKLSAWSTEQRAQLPDGFPDPREIVDSLNTYAEISPSGTGIKLIAYSLQGLDGPGRHCGDFEIYDRRRFFTITGRKLRPSPKAPRDINCRDGYLQTLYGMLPTASTSTADDLDWDTEEHPDGISDRKIIRTLQLDSQFNGNGAKSLWDGDLSHHGDDHSVADSAMVNHIAFYAGPYPVIIDRIFRESGLMRRKWERESYRRSTIGHVLANKDRFYQWKPSQRSNVASQDYQRFPAHVLPAVIQEYVEQQARAIGVDVAMVAVPMLSTLAALIGQARRIQLRSGWSEPSILWTAVICDIGDAKSPSMNAASIPADVVDERLRIENQQQKAEFEAQLAAWSRNKQGPKPKKPLYRQLIVQNATLEGVHRRLDANWKGLFYIRDELASWIKSFNQYRKGSDAEAWLTFHGGMSESTDRATDDLHLDRIPCAISLAGTIQPAVARKVLLCNDATENGLAARVLLCNPEHPFKPDEGSVHAVSASLLRKIQKLGHLLYDLHGADTPAGKKVPVMVILADGVERLFLDFKNETRSDALDLKEPSAGAWKKLNAHAARVALVLSVTRQLLEDRKSDATSPVTVADMEAAIEIMEWFGRELERFYATLDEDADQQELRELATWIKRKHQGRITPRQLQRGKKDVDTVKEAKAILEDLQDAGFGTIEEQLAKNNRRVQVFVCT